MLQVRKSRYCGISAILFQCCVIIETQVLIGVSDFWGFFFYESFPGRGLLFSMEGFVFQLGASFLSWVGDVTWRGINFDVGGGGSEKIIGWGKPCQQMTSESNGYCKMSN